MTKPINLNKARKAKNKRDARQKADENAVRFGRTKGQKALDKADSDASIRKLDQHKRDTE